MSFEGSIKWLFDHMRHSKYMSHNMLGARSSFRHPSRPAMAPRLHYDPSARGTCSGSKSRLLGDNAMGKARPEDNYI